MDADLEASSPWRGDEKGIWSSYPHAVQAYHSGNTGAIKPVSAAVLFQ